MIRLNEKYKKSIAGPKGSAKGMKANITKEFNRAYVAQAEIERKNCKTTVDKNYKCCKKLAGGKEDTKFCDYAYKRVKMSCAGAIKKGEGAKMGFNPTNFCSKKK